MVHMFRSQACQLDLNRAGVRRLIGLARPGTDGLSKNARTRASAALREHGRPANQFEVVLPDLQTLLVTERMAHVPQNATALPQRLGGQLQFVEAHTLWR